MRDEEFETFLFDLNGTLTRWNETIIGAEDLVHSVRDSGADAAFLTDNSLLSAGKWASKLRQLGIYTDEDTIVTSGGAATREMRKRGIREAYLMGSSHLHDEVEFRSTKDAENVVLGLDRQFSYKKMKEAAEILEEGDLFVLSRRKRVHTRDGSMPHQKPLNDALANFAEPTLLGKPGEAYASHVEQKLSYRPGKTLLVGDTIDDVRLGRRLGVKTALVMSGETDREELAGLDESDKPDYGLSNLSRLTRRL